MNWDFGPAVLAIYIVAAAGLFFLGLHAITISWAVLRNRPKPFLAGNKTGIAVLGITLLLRYISADLEALVWQLGAAMFLISIPLWIAASIAWFWRRMSGQPIASRPEHTQNALPDHAIGLITWVLSLTFRYRFLIPCIGLIYTAIFVLLFTETFGQQTLLLFALHIIFFWPIVSDYTCGVLFNPIGYPIILLAAHVYTVILACHSSILKGVVSFFLPVISEIYWFIVIAMKHGTIRNVYCFLMGLIAYTWIYEMFLAPFVIYYSSNVIGTIGTQMNAGETTEGEAVGSEQGSVTGEAFDKLRRKTTEPGSITNRAINIILNQFSGDEIHEIEIENGVEDIAKLSEVQAIQSITRRGLDYPCPPIHKIERADDKNKTPGRSAVMSGESHTMSNGKNKQPQRKPLEFFVVGPNESKKEARARFREWLREKSLHLLKLSEKEKLDAAAKTGSSSKSPNA